MKRSFWLGMAAAGVAIVLAAAATGCEDEPAGPVDRSAARRAGGVLAFVGAGPRDPLWPILKAGAERYDREMCMLHVDYHCPKGDSPQDQIELLQGLAGTKLRGLCIQLENVPALEPTLQDLYNRGVLIVSMIKPAPEAIRAAHVGFDEVAVGEGLADAAAQAVGEQGTVMLLHAGTGDPVYNLRLAGFDRRIAWYGQVKVLAEVDGRSDPAEGRRLIRDRFARFPRLSAWVALDDWPLRGLTLTDRPLPAGSRLVTLGG